MVHDELLAAFEEVFESAGPVGTGEGVGLGELDHGEVAELGVDGCVGVEGGFFLDEEGFAGGEPFGG